MAEFTQPECGLKPQQVWLTGVLSDQSLIRRLGRLACTTERIDEVRSAWPNWQCQLHMIISEVHFEPLPLLLGLCNLGWLRRPYGAEKLSREGRGGQGQDLGKGTSGAALPASCIWEAADRRDLWNCEMVHTFRYQWRGHYVPGSGLNLGNITTNGQTRSCLLDFQVSNRQEQQSVLSVDAGSTGGWSGIGGWVSIAVRTLYTLF